MSSPCYRCQYEEPVRNTAQLKPGQQVKLPGRIPGFGKLYYHHYVIDKLIEVRNEHQVKLKIYDYNKGDEDSPRPGLHVQHRNEDYDLQKQELYIIHPKGNNYDEEKTLENAERCYKEDPKYNIFTSNCEHLANLIRFGVSKSKQWEEFKSGFLTCIEEAPKVLAEILLKLKEIIFDGVEIFIEFLENVLESLPVGLGSVVFQCCLSLIFSIVRHVLHRREWKKNNICNSHYKIFIFEIWFSFFAQNALAILVSVSLACIPLPPPVTLALGLGVFFLAICIRYVARKRVRRNITQFLWKKVAIRNSADINVGDIISFKYCKLDHKGIVTSAPADVNDGVKLKVIHYAYCGVFNSREIKKETFVVKPEETYICEVDRSICYEPQDVVSRAKARKGEKKFNTLYARSSHFCQWAKVRDPNQILHQLANCEYENDDTYRLADEKQTNSEQKQLQEDDTEIHRYILDSVMVGIQSTDDDTCELAAKTQTNSKQKEVKVDDNKIHSLDSVMVGDANTIQSTDDDNCELVAKKETGSEQKDVQVDGVVVGDAFTIQSSKDDTCNSAEKGQTDSKQKQVHINEIEVHLLDDLMVGDAITIQSSNCGTDHGILTGKMLQEKSQNKQRQFSVTLIRRRRYGLARPCDEIKQEIDLKLDLYDKNNLQIN